MTATSFEYRTHYEEGVPVRAGVRRSAIAVDDADLGDEGVLIHELAHVLARSRFGPDAEVHGSEFIVIKDTMREAFGHAATGDVW